MVSVLFGCAVCMINNNLCNCSAAEVAICLLSNTGLMVRCIKASLDTVSDLIKCFVIGR